MWSFANKMDETNNQIDPIEKNEDNGNDNSDIEDEDSDHEDDWKKHEYCLLDEAVLQRLKQNDPSITGLKISLVPEEDDDSECFFNSVDWEVDGDSISDNTQLKGLFITYQVNGLKPYVLGEQGNNLPTKQQLRDFFSCIHRNSSIKALSLRSFKIIDEFGGDLIKGLQGHSSLTKLEITFGRIESTVVLPRFIGKVLKHPTSKLRNLRLPDCGLFDLEIGIVCDALVGSSMMKKLDLSGNDKITIGGWRKLSTVIRHPNCKLAKLSLSWNGITDESAHVLGSALSGLSSLKDLDLSFNFPISSTGWHTLLNQLSETSIEDLGLKRSNIDDAGLISLANIGTLKSLDLYSSNESATPAGWSSFFHSLQRKGTQLVKLGISHSNIGIGGIDVLRSLLTTSSNTLKTLDMSNMRGRDPVTPRGWQTLFTSLQDSNLDLVKLNLSSNSIDDEGIQLLVPLLSNMTSLTHLTLENNYSVTPAGWQLLIGYLQSPNFTLEELHFFNESNLHEETLVAFASALAHNITLKVFALENWRSYDDDSDDEVSELVTDRGWEALSNLICNRLSIMDTYNSNHTLEDLRCEDPPKDVSSSLVLNKNKDKSEVARQKILQTHFSGSDASELQEFLDMELAEMPAAIAWIGRPTVGWVGKNVSGLSLLYNLIRRFPDLFDSSTQKKPSMGKRKRDS